MTQVERTEGSSATKWTAEGSGILAGGSGRVETEALARFVREASLSHRFAGRATDVDRAQRFLEENGLDRDQHLAALLRMRRESGNTLVEQRIEVSTVEESRRLRRLAGRCQVPFREVQGELDTVVTKQVEYGFTFSVTF